MRAIKAIGALTALCLSALAGGAGTEPAPAVPRVPDALAPIPVYLALEAGSGQPLAARAPDLRFVPASLTKVMTAYLAFELMAASKLRPDQRFTVTKAQFEAWRGKGTSMNLREGESVPVDALLHGITTVSANDACVVLAEGYAGSVENWAALMNAEARKLGLANSHFHTPNGWPDGGETYVSARDLVTLGEALIRLHPALYRTYFGKRSFTWDGVTQENHEPTVGVVPGADGIKTGHTSEAGFGFLGSAVRGGRRVLLVVAGAHSETERTAASRALMEWSFAAWDSRVLFKAQAPVAEARVQGGDARHVPLLAAQDITLAVPKGTHPAARLSLHYNGPLVAPLRKGDVVGELVIEVPGQADGHVPLLAGRSVGPAGPFDRLVNGLAGWLP